MGRIKGKREGGKKAEWVGKGEEGTTHRWLVSLREVTTIFY